MYQSKAGICLASVESVVTYGLACQTDIHANVALYIAQLLLLSTGRYNIPGGQVVTAFCQCVSGYMCRHRCSVVVRASLPLAVVSPACIHDWPSFAHSLRTSQRTSKCSKFVRAVLARCACVYYQNRSWEQMRLKLLYLNICRVVYRTKLAYLNSVFPSLT